MDAPSTSSQNALVVSRSETKLKFFFVKTKGTGTLRKSLGYQFHEHVDLGSKASDEDER